MGIIITTNDTFDRAWLYPVPGNGSILVPYDGNLTATVREAVAQAIAKQLKMPPMKAARLENDARAGILHGWQVTNFRVRKIGPTGDVSFRHSKGSGYHHVVILPMVVQ